MYIVSQGCAFHIRYAVPFHDWFSTVMPDMLDLWRAIRSTIANKANVKSTTL